MEHDLGQLSDVGLVDAIVDLKPHTVDAEGSVYGGVAALVMIEQIETANPTAFSPTELAKDVRVAVHDIERGLHHLPQQDLVELQSLVADEGSILIPVVETAVQELSTLAHIHLPTHAFDLFA